MTLSLSRSCAELLAISASCVCPFLTPLKASVFEDGFSYDFLATSSCEASILPLISYQMKRYCVEGIPFELLTMMPKNAQSFLLSRNQPVQAALLGEVQENLVQLCKLGSFYDLCPEEVLETTSQIKEFALYELLTFRTSHGLFGNVQVVRIRGAAYSEKKALKQRLKQVEIAKKNDPVKLAETLDFAFFSEEALFLLPKGESFCTLFERAWRKECEQHFFQFVSTPLMIKNAYLTLFQRYEGTSLQLPYRFAETVFQENEVVSKQFEGLFETKNFHAYHLNVFCTKEQSEKEQISLLQFMMKMATITGLDVSVSEEKKTRALARFELQIRDLRGRKWPISEMKVTTLGNSQRSMHIQASAILSVERILGLLLEKHGGQMPLWLAPEQVRVLVVNSACVDWAEQVFEKLCMAGIRATFDKRDANSYLSDRIYRAWQQKVPICCILGEKEKKKQSVNLRFLEQDSTFTARMFEDEVASFIRAVHACCQTYAWNIRY